MYEAHLRSLLSPLGIYDLEEHSASGAAVCALGTGLDTVSRRLEEIEREALTATAEGEGLARREALLAQREAQLEKEQAAFEAAGWALDGQVHKEKLYYPAETPLVSALLEVYRDATGDNAPPKCIGGGTYAKAIPNVVAFGPIFPGDEVREHKPDEFMEIDRLMENVHIFAEALYRLAR